MNPVTGYIKPEGPDPMAGMTEEQKEYEAMKLMNAMNKMIDSGGQLNALITLSINSR